MKNSTPSSEFEHEDKCPSCGSPCNIHTDLDANDNCNECRDQINAIPTAEEFCNERLGFEEYGTDTPYFMIEFAKLHVEAALKQASEKAISREDVAIFAEGTYKLQVIDRLSILNAYPLTLIK